MLSPQRAPSQLLKMYMKQVMTQGKKFFGKLQHWGRAQQSYAQAFRPEVLLKASVGECHPQVRKVSGEWSAWEIDKREGTSHQETNQRQKRQFTQDPELGPWVDGGSGIWTDLGNTPGVPQLSWLIGWAERRSPCMIWPFSLSAT